jgi:5-methylcytosine-specific restriction endonuclease McrA
MSNPYGSRLYQRNRRAVLDAAGWRCHWCGQPATTADHVHPLAYGGTHDQANLVPSCVSCNASRGTEITNERKAAKRLGRRSRRW